MTVWFIYFVVHFGGFLWFELPDFEGYAELEGFQCGRWRDNQKSKKQSGAIVEKSKPEDKGHLGGRKTIFSYLQR